MSLVHFFIIKIFLDFFFEDWIHVNVYHGQRLPRGPGLFQCV